MTSRVRSTLTMIAVLSGVGIAIGALVMRVSGNERPAVAKPPDAAVVAQAVKEADLNTVTLTPQAVTRLDLKTAKVERERRTRSRTLPGEVISPPGQSVVVTAPVAGTIRQADPASRPATAPARIAPGMRVAENTPVFLLLPILTAESRATIAAALVDAESQIKNSDVQRKAATAALQRARKLFEEQAGTQRALEEAQAAFDLADQAVKAAEARRALLAQALGQTDDGSVSPMVVASPVAGVVTAVRVAPGQTVLAGTTLFEVVDPSLVWIRVSASAGEAREIAAGHTANVMRLGEMVNRSAADRVSYAAEPTGAPPVGAPITSTIDLTYSMANPGSAPLTPGERVAVTLTLQGGEEENLVIPWSAVVYDFHGGAWAYEVTGPRQYARKRVDVRYVDNGRAVLRSGPAVGAEVVVTGAEELFGREMGHAK